jgi:hypothetical protein
MLLIGAVVLASASSAIGMILLNSLGLVGTDVNSGVPRFIDVLELNDVLKTAIGDGYFATVKSSATNLAQRETQREVLTPRWRACSRPSRISRHGARRCARNSAWLCAWHRRVAAPPCRLLPPPLSRRSQGSSCEVPFCQGNIRGVATRSGQCLCVRRRLLHSAADPGHLSNVVMALMVAP